LKCLGWNIKDLHGTEVDPRNWSFGEEREACVVGAQGGTTPMWLDWLDVVKLRDGHGGERVAMRKLSLHGSSPLEIIYAFSTSCSRSPELSTVQTSSSSASG
jgi:hypothetical protein